MRARKSPSARRFASVRRLLAILLLGMVACAGSTERSMEVTATAYNSLPQQTNDDPRLAAWGDILRPGTKSIAVSRDLLELGLGRGVRVKIEGLEGEYVVLDKMARRWTKKIDIYMGTDVAAARRWGKKKVRITWKEKSP